MSQILNSDSPNNTKAMIINAAEPNMTRVVITNKKGRKHDVVHFDIDSKHQRERQTMSNIYKAIVTSVEPSLNAVFVNFGGDRHGFLPLSNISSEYFLEAPSNKGNPKPEDLNRLIKVGQELVVQVEKEERGNKGAALTTFISLAGSYVVLMPNNDRGGGVSRQIEGAEREALKNKIASLEVPEGMSLIVRTAGVGRSLEDLKWDLSILLRYWDAIKKAAIAKPGPYLIVEESDIVLRSVRDHFRQDIDEVIIDEEAAYERVRNYINLVRPDFIDRIKYYTNSTPIFSYYQVETQVSTAFDREVRLRSGASIVIDPTEALVAIDVNSAKATKGANIEETAFQTNLQATDEIARQIRFRDLSGLIVIDYIDMVEPSHRRIVEERLAEAMSVDRARVQRTRISELGLLELSRQRLRRTLTRLTNTTCPRCNGQGLIRTVESLANSIVHNMQDNQAKTSNPLHFTLQCPLDLTTYLMNERRADIQKLTDLYQTKVTIIPNQHMLTPTYQLKQTELNADKTSQHPASYQQLKQNKSGPNVLLAQTQKQHSRASFNEPAINEYLSIPTEREQQEQSGLLGRLAKRWFGGSEESEDTAEAEKKTTSASKTQDKNRRAQRSSRQTASKRGERPRRQTQSQQRRRSDSPRRDKDTEEQGTRPSRQRSTETRSASNSSNTIRATPKADKAKRTSTRRGSRGGSRPATTPEETTAKRPENSVSAAPKERNIPPATTEKPAPIEQPTKPAAESKPETPTTPPKKSLSSARRAPGARQARPMPKKVEKKPEEASAKSSDAPTAPTPPKRYKKTPSSARQVSRRPIPKKAEKPKDDTDKKTEASD